MFEMHPGALEQGMARRDELVRSSWTPRRGHDDQQRRVAEILRFRHAFFSLYAQPRHVLAELGERLLVQETGEIVGAGLADDKQVRPPVSGSMGSIHRSARLNLIQ